MTVQYEYLRDGAAICDKSFATIHAEADLTRFDDATEQIVVRMIHSCGMVDIAADISYTPGVVTAARAALAAGAPIFCDTTMVAAGINRATLPADNEVICTLGHPDVALMARKSGGTRAAAATNLWADRLNGAVVVIGNAPTTLFRLLEILDDGAATPSAIVGMPVGFVGAAESKQALDTSGYPSLVLHGRRGGSALATAAANALTSADEQDCCRVLP